MTFPFVTFKRAGSILAFVAAASLLIGGTAAHADPGPSIQQEVATGLIATPVQPLNSPSEPGTLYAVAASGAVLGCKSSYDNPHPSKSSNYKKINAHYTVKCEGPESEKVKIVVKSKMTTTSGRAGTLSEKSSKKTAKTGGDLSCTKKAESFKAKGSYKVTWPAGYKPLTSSFSKDSKSLKFKLATSGAKKGQCVAG